MAISCNAEFRHAVVYGGQYGSEGKASAAEFFAKLFKKRGHKLFVLGENSPNSGHTCSRGATKNLPAASFWADAIVLGPDAVVDKDVLVSDWEKVGRKPLYIHEHAALLNSEAKLQEADVVARISSTGSGSGSARRRKFIERQPDAVVKGLQFPKGIELVDDMQFRSLTHLMWHQSAILECSQGVMLDTNFGRYPHVTSRTTLPRAAVERNGVGWLPWHFCGVFRTYPIRTGGPSGPTGGPELSWDLVGQKPEIATVTKRVRRVFAFSVDEFCKSIHLCRPDVIMFTFLDYIGVRDLNDLSDFREWLSLYGIDEVRRMPVFVSNKTGSFVEYDRM
jgi:adenylosuccinate synthase